MGSGLLYSQVWECSISLHLGVINVFTKMSLKRDIIGEAGPEKSPPWVSVKGDIFEHLPCVRHSVDTMHSSCC